MCISETPCFALRNKHDAEHRVVSICVFSALCGRHVEEVGASASSMSPSARTIDEVDAQEESVDEQLGLALATFSVRSTCPSGASVATSTPKEVGDLSPLTLVTADEKTSRPHPASKGSKRRCRSAGRKGFPRRSSGSSLLPRSSRR